MTVEVSFVFDDTAQSPVLDELRSSDEVRVPAAVLVNRQQLVLLFSQSNKLIGFLGGWCEGFLDDNCK